VESYVVHIYRRPRKGGGALVGLVERIGNGERKAFQGEAQLLAYLSLEAPGRKRITSGKDVKKT
jgi:hypothetical protein